jgi:hypothetical protein
MKFCLGTNEDRPGRRIKFAPGTNEFAPGIVGKRAKTLQAQNLERGALREYWVMKLFTGWVLTAGLVLVAGGAQAQTLSPNETSRARSTAVSDVGGPYAAVPDVARPGPRLLPPMEVYTVVRESGFSPLGIPHQRGYIYTIAVIDRGGEDGRLVIDARNGRVIRFVPAYGMGGNFNDVAVADGPPGAMSPPTDVRGGPRPPRSVPHVASRTVPLPKANPLTTTNPATEPTPPAQQSAAAQPKPAETQMTQQQVTQQAAAPTVGQAKPPAPPIAPTEEMPKVQGLE